MNDLLDRAVKSALQDFFDAAPERSDTPLEPAHRSPRSPSRTTLIAAATVVVVGVGGLLAVRLGDNPAGSGAATTPESTEAANNTYTVVSGDYLANIAERHCVTMDEIANYNNWSDGASHPLFPDQVILIPPGGCVPDPGEGLTDEQAMSPSLFPVVPDVSDSRTRASFSQTSWDNAPRVEAALGRVEEDGTIVDGVVIEVGLSFVRETADSEVVTVFGHEATLYRDGGSPVITTVVWGDSPYIAVQGRDPVAFLDEASEDFLTIESYDNGTPAALTFNELPPGYEIVVDSTRLALGSVDAQVLLPESGGDGHAVDVSVRNPLLSALTVGAVSPVDVDGTTGWITGDSGTSVTWQVDDSTYAQVWGTDTVETALELAGSIEWVDVGTWMATYHLELPVFGPG